MLRLILKINFATADPSRRAWLAPAALALGACAAPDRPEPALSTPTQVQTLSVAPSEPSEPSERIERQLAAMGTWLTLRVEAPTRAEALQASERAYRAIREVEARLSTWNPASPVSRLNAARGTEAVALPPAVLNDLAAALELARRTQFTFDPAAGAVVSAWTAAGAPAALEAAAALGGPGALELDATSARWTRPGAAVADGAWVKGAALDAAARALGRTAATSAALDFGGQWLAYGAPLEIEVAHPDDRERPALRLTLPAGWSAATSANGATIASSERPHLLDPRSGSPAADFGSVTVLSPSALTADALSTGLFVVGPRAALAFAAANADCEVLILERSSDPPHLQHSADVSPEALP